MRRFSLPSQWLGTPLKFFYILALWLVHLPPSKQQRPASHWSNCSPFHLWRYAFRIDRSVGWCGTSGQRTNQKPPIWQASFIRARYTTSSNLARVLVWVVVQNFSGSLACKSTNTVHKMHLFFLNHQTFEIQCLILIIHFVFVESSFFFHS